MMVHSRRFLFRLCGALLIFFLASSGNAAESNLYRSELGTAQLSAESPIHAGTPFDVKLNLTLAPHWHTYADPPGEAGIPPRIDWELPEGFSAGSLRFPAPRSFHEGGLTTYGYENRVTLTSRFTPAATLRDAVTIKARASWLVCHDICIPESAAFTLMLPASAVPREHGAEGLSYILLLALLGGLVLNLMPCVLPVLSFKALSLSRLAHIHPAAARMEGIAYTLGIATCFGALAAMLIALRQAGAAIGWGYQLQSPAFVAFLAVLLFLIGLSFSGWLRLPGFSMGRGVAAPRHPFWNSFFTGALAALVATPCTAPFMAAATGYALTLAALPALLVFEVMALGLALPFLLISFFPAALRFLPRPGAWMERLKELLAFPMYISAT
ncbi:MAG: hypothetical protein JO089_00130, partial [Alphaproteobacteria bacterium]|nr:hypothetical protein [Alphaproteobacteria bacterium]